MNGMAQDWSQLGLGVQSLLILAAGIAAALLTVLFFARFVGALTRRTRTTLDDRLARALRGPVATSMVLVAAWIVVSRQQPDEGVEHAVRGVLLTVAIVVWGAGGLRAADAFLDWFVYDTHSGRRAHSWRPGRSRSP